MAFAESFFVAKAFVVTADDFPFGGYFADFVVDDAVSCHVDAHVGRTFIGAISVDKFKCGVKYGEGFHVAVVVDGCDSVGVEVERVDDVDVVKVGGGGFVGQVDRVFQRNVPDRESFEFGISGVDSSFVFVVELRKANGEFSAAWAWGCDHHERAFGFNVFVLTISIV